MDMEIDELIDSEDEISKRDEIKQRRLAITSTKEGTWYFQHEEYQMARISFKRSIDAGSKNYGNYFLKSQAEYALNDLEDACINMRMAHELAPPDGNQIRYKCQLWLLKMKMEMGQMDYCRKRIKPMKLVYDTLIDENFKYLESEFRKLSDCMSLLKQEKNPTKIIELCKDAIVYAPKCANLYLKQGNAFLKIGNYLDARSAFVSALTYDSECWKAKYCQYKAFYMSGCLTKAKESLKFLMDRNVYQTIVKFLLGEIELLVKEQENEKIHTQLKNLSAAKDCLLNCRKILDSSKILLKNSKFEFEVCLKLAAINTEEGNNIEALDWCRKALEIDNKCAKAFILQGDIEIVEQRFSDAAESYKAAIHLDNYNIALKRKLDSAISLIDFPDHYGVLGVKSFHLMNEINRVYKNLVLKFHPDKNRDASKAEIEKRQQQFIRIKKASDTLLDPEERMKYDSTRNKLLEPFHASHWDVFDFLLNISHPFQ